MKLDENSLNQFKAFLLSLVQKNVGPNLASWFAKLLEGVKLPPTGPTLVIAGASRPVGDAPDEVKSWILNALQTAIAAIPRPLVRIALSALVSRVLPRLIDQVYDAIVGGKTQGTLLLAPATAGDAADLADLIACDADFGLAA